MTELKDGCVQPARGPIAPETGATVTPHQPTTAREATTMQARVGQEAIDFEATAFIEGKGFQPVRLSEYRGQWIVLCFYPGDFTFV
jgi:peroxiredoxin (alkyl hydroperoxide reductase subunit C)